MVRGLGARGIEAQRPEMAGLDDSGGLLGLVTRRKKGREKGDRLGIEAKWISSARYGGQVRRAADAW